MKDVSQQEPTAVQHDVARSAVAPVAAATATQRLAAERMRQHQDEELDEVLLESFPASDPPSSWAGP